VLGVEGDLNWVSASQSRAADLNKGSGHGGPETASFKFDALGSVRARAGLAFDRTLAYVTAGPAFGHFNSAVTLLNGSFGSGVRDVATDDDWHVGLAAGAGIEFMLDPYWTVRGEYLLLNFPDVVANFVPTSATHASDAITQRNFGYSAQLARVALNYKFGGTGYQAPAHASPPASWAGLYIGANAGGGITKSDFLDDCFSCDDATFHTGFGMIGGQVGYNWQWASAVFGLEGDLDWASAKEAHTLDPLNSCCNGTATFKVDALGSIRARAGLAVDHTLAYVTAGPAFGHFNSDWTTSPTAGDQFTAADQGWRFGIAAGAGVEFMLSPNWSLRGEFLDFIFGDKVAACVPLNATAVSDHAATVCHITFANSALVARVGLNYRFDWGGGPIATKD
jgi:outer membrane immunogenic protein